jgi:hypothetical protein
MRVAATAFAAVLWVTGERCDNFFGLVWFGLVWFVYQSSFFL